VNLVVRLLRGCEKQSLNLQFPFKNRNDLSHPIKNTHFDDLDMLVNRLSGAGAAPLENRRICSDLPPARRGGVDPSPFEVSRIISEST